MEIILHTSEWTQCATHSPVVCHPLLVFEGLLLLLREVVIVFRRLGRVLRPLHGISVRIVKGNQTVEKVTIRIGLEHSK